MDSLAWSKSFPVAAVSRLDLTDKGFPVEVIAQLTDADMQAIADKMSDLYCDNGYWEDLVFVTELYLAERDTDNRTGGQNGERNQSV